MPTARNSDDPESSGHQDGPELSSDLEDGLHGRKAAILNAVVEEYIETAQPVGSGHVTRAPGIDVSSATVRSEMAALERDGFLVQPHTSAGRIPTDKGYRFFVDHLAAPGAPAEAERHEVRHFFAQMHGEVEELLARTSGLLTSLTDHATVVVGPSHDTAAIRAAQLVVLAPTVLLVLVVLGDGAVERRTIELPSPVAAEDVDRATGRLSGCLTGHRLGELPEVVPSGDQGVDVLVAAALEAVGRMRHGDADQVFVGGSSRVAAAFDAVETVRSVLAILEQQLVVVELIEDVLDRGLSVAIGAEHGFEPLASCALVVSPVTVDGEAAGTVGVLGPTRMNYPKALAAVRLVGEQLGTRLAAWERLIMAAAREYYDLLGVPVDASDDQIKRAYRKLARQLHPDSTGGDAEAESRFKQVVQAYEVLRDPERRARYDRFGPSGVDSSSSADPFAGGGFGDLFDAFFGMAGGNSRSRGRSGPARGADAEVVLGLAFREAVFGARRELPIDGPVACPACQATGARPGTTAIRCPECGGSGEMRRVRQSILGQVVTAVTCTSCQGMGEAVPSPCPECRGEGRRSEHRTLTVDVPAGVDHGATLRLTGQGPAGPRGGPAGDLYVHLSVEPDESFARRGDELFADLHVPMTQAALGATVTVETLDGHEQVAIAVGTQTGTVVRLRSRGVPHVRGRGRGDLLVNVVVDTPTDLSSTQRDLLRRLAEERGEAVGATSEGIVSRLRSAFG